MIVVELIAITVETIFSQFVKIQRYTTIVCYQIVHKKTWVHSSSLAFRWAMCYTQGRIQDFKLGGIYLKKLRWVEGGAKIFGVFRVKNHDFTPKNHIFSNFRGRRAPPLDPSLIHTVYIWCHKTYDWYNYSASHVDANEGHLSKRCMGRHGDFIRIISPMTQLSDTYTVYRGVSYISSF